jgi:hypothetical protein
MEWGAARPEVLIRGAAQGIFVSCLVGGVAAAACHDWPDAVLIGLLGAFSAVSARKMSWQLRQGPYTGTTVGADDIVVR